MNKGIESKLIVDPDTRKTFGKRLDKWRKIKLLDTKEVIGK